MKKIPKKLIKKIWWKCTKCWLYVKAKEKTSCDVASDKLFMRCAFFINYINSVLDCLKKSDSRVLTAEYINRTGKDATYTRSGWYAKVRRANIAFFKYFDKSVL